MNMVVGTHVAIEVFEISVQHLEYMVIDSLFFLLTLDTFLLYIAMVTLSTTLVPDPSLQKSYSNT